MEVGCKRHKERKGRHKKKNRKTHKKAENPDKNTDEEKQKKPVLKRPARWHDSSALDLVPAKKAAPWAHSAEAEETLRVYFLSFQSGCR